MSVTRPYTATVRRIARLRWEWTVTHRTDGPTAIGGTARTRRAADRRAQAAVRFATGGAR